MAKLPFRQHHLLQLLEEYSAQHLPLDLFMSNYFRAHKALGPKDRGWVAETVYAMIRWLGLIDHLCGEPSPDWETRFNTLDLERFEEIQNDPDLPGYVKASFPQALYDLFVQSHGQEKGVELCLLSNQPAPTTVRINPLKTTREEMLKRWQGIYDVSPCMYSPLGITFHKKINFFGTPEFAKGLFEVQDEGSQLLANLVAAEPGQQVLDYCAGSGGKTLAFAPGMQNKGQVFLHDIRLFALTEAKKRLKRSGIQNGQIVQADDEKLKKLKKKMDWVLVDAPCTGTGTLRRNPDMKWKFESAVLERLLGQQRNIFEKALSYLKPNGKIVYATCSLLKQENQDQIEHFVKVYDLEVVGVPFQSLPSKKGMDGFYGVTLQKKQ